MKFRTEVWVHDLPAAVIDEWLDANRPVSPAVAHIGIPTTIRIVADDGVPWEHCVEVHVADGDFATLDEAIAWRPNLDPEKQTIVGVDVRPVVRVR